MELINRKLPRLKNYDYATPGAYFITMCTHDKQCFFGHIIPGDSTGDAGMRYSPMGEIAKKCLLDLESHYRNIKIDNWVIMPNHIHLLIQISKSTEPNAACDVSNIIGKYKAAVTRTVGNAFMHSGKLWQKSFYDHIVRNDEDYQNIWEYISGNPSKWLEDRFYCK